jgi:hypothetical protein
MNERIIYQNNDGGVSIIIPTGEALQTLTIDDIAKKDVPAGVPYKIVDVADIPEDRTFRGAWEAEITEPDGVGLGYDAWFALQPKPVEVENDND